MNVPPDLKPGDPLTLAYLNGVADAARAGRVSVDTSSGMEAQVGPWGTAIAYRRPVEGWYKVVSAGAASGTYNLKEVLDVPGGWADGVRTPLAREVNNNAAVPISASNPTYVYAWRGRLGFLFQYGSCSSGGSGTSGTGSGLAPQD